MAPKTKQNWTRDEHIVAFNLYFKMPFGSIGMGNQKVIDLAKLIGRSVGSVSYKLTNFARLDPALKARGVRGHEHGAKGEEDVWKEFADDPESLLFESERILAARLGQAVEDVAEVEVGDLPAVGIERDAVLKVRVNQSVFRRRIFSIYKGRCCVSGIAIPELLVASHISPWAEDTVNRLNTRNGLCLNSLHDRAFDRGLMWVDNGMLVRFSSRLRKTAKKSDTTLEWVTSFEGMPLQLSTRVRPDPELLRKHAERHAH